MQVPKSLGTFATDAHEEQLFPWRHSEDLQRLAPSITYAVDLHDIFPAPITVTSFAPHPSSHVHRPIYLQPANHLLDGSRSFDPRADNALLYYLFEEGLLKIPESEIKGTLDHGEQFAKTVAFIKTAWFVAKIIGRIRENLFITELEVVALGSTCLTFAAYQFWWSKPQRVRHPYRVLIGKEPLPSNVYHSGQSHTVSVPLPLFSEPSSKATHRHIGTPIASWVAKAFRNLRTRVERLFEQPLVERLRKDYSGIFRLEDHPERKIASLLFLPVYPLVYLGKQIMTITNADGARGSVPDYLFLSGLHEGNTPLFVYGSTYCIAVGVGALHFLRWTSPSLLSPSEQLSWRISTIMTTVLPLTLALTHRQLQTTRPGERWTRYKKIATVLHGLAILFYVVARYTLIILAFKALCQPPPDAFREVRFSVGILQTLG
ncbi:hypothetical protein V5O48_012434 [Marasmius crinis-equi]|uniref:Uncharacterized protein n=1 Tax=Marasmius crinis-equi TaxID=585013 RepID=A0ABR3F2T6_9AGAR